MHRLIQALTLNIDLSSLFADVLMNAATSDVATKKMLYHYIGVYSDKGKESEELAMMTINTLQKDTKHEDPTIRGLAIRSMTSLRLRKQRQATRRAPCPAWGCWCRRARAQGGWAATGRLPSSVL